MSKIRLKVSQESIDTALQHQKDGAMTPQTCVIAMALKAKFPNQYVAVGFESALVGRKVYVLSPKARKAVNDFDAKREVTPFETAITLRY